ncbi:hypothetical protein KUTeg_020736 [Tegillarca granosa]|uniref:Protein Wnt n=1 Tax=Tegillarca granosa TaxID=220873 RepID=A0ABQ9E8U8_TEGGR|nr:hypothetical protein KUTeg_020736 [Tegillarca granosa]
MKTRSKATTNMLYQPKHKTGSKEAGFSYAVSSAGVTFAITQACSLGKLDRCSCDKTKKKGHFNSRGWRWGGCSADIKHGLKFSRKFLDSREIDQTERSLMNLHNNRAGRKSLNIIRYTLFDNQKMLFFAVVCTEICITA